MPRYESPHAHGGSHDDPHGGYHPDQRSPGRSAWQAEEEVYGPPADPWRSATTGPAGGYPGAATPEPMWDSAGADAADWASGEPRRPPSGVRRLLVVLAVALVVCGAASVTGYLLVRDDPAPATGGQSPGPVSTPQPSATVGTPLPQSSTDVRFVIVGQCVRNEGGGDKPKLTITQCGPRTYQVLERFDGATTGKDDARSKCSAVPGYTDWYFFDSPLDVLDYVLCLKSR